MSYTPLPIPDPTGDQWGEQLNDAIGDRTNDKIKKIFVGRGLHIDTSDPQQPVISRTDVDLLGLQQYKGEWEGESSLIYSQDFTSLPDVNTLPPELESTNSATPGAGTPIAWDISLVAPSDPLVGDYPKYFKPGSSLGANLHIDLTKISTPRFQIHSLKFYNRYSGAPRLIRVYVDGMVVYSIDAPSSFLTEASLTGFIANKSIVFTLSASSNTHAGVAGIRLFGRIHKPPYAMNDIVSYNGVLYKCMYAGTTAVPGTSGHWTVVPYSILPSGAPYTEAINATVVRADARVDDKYDALWGAPAPYDLEFDSDTSLLPSGWGWVNQGTSTYTQKFGCGVVNSLPPADSSMTIRGISRDFPIESSWSLTAKISGNSVRTGESFGLFLEDTANGDYVLLSKSLAGISVGHYSDTSTLVTETTPLNVVDVSYYKLVYNSPTSVDFLVSSDGVSWNQIETGYNLSSKITSASKVGFFSSKNEVAVHWLRVRTS